MKACKSGNSKLSRLVAAIGLCSLALQSFGCASPKSPSPQSPSERPASPAPGNASARATGRCFLVGVNNEDCGYGLYSYLLLGSTPNEANRDRYLQGIRAFLRFTPDIGALEQSGMPQRALNIAYIPLVDSSAQSARLKTLTSAGLTDTEEDANCVLLNYNYSRARALLSAIPGAQHLEGPYFVSTLKPLVGIREVTENYLFQDLSTVPTEIITPWVKEFIQQAGQEQFWEARNAMQFTLKLRKSIALLSVAGKESGEAWLRAKKTLQKLIDWKKDESEDQSKGKKKTDNS